ncbi:MAG TPA: glycosyltransferase family 39 protein, partial [Gemmatimonadaceae bacterium]
MTMITTAPPQRRHSPFVSLLPYAVAAVIFITIRFATNGTLGFHIDELYYLESGRHLTFGYVDYPPIVPLLSRVETSVLGVTPWALRFLPAIAGAVNVMLGAAYVRKLGGSVRLQALALLVGLTTPILLGTFLFQTVVFDLLAWMASLYLFLSIVVERKPRTWMLLGLSLGVGLEIKFLILPLIAGMVIATFVTPSLRADLRTRYPWIGGALMLLIWLPNVVWQIANDFPTVDYIFNHQGDIRSGGGVAVFVVVFLLLLFLLTPLWIVGFISLFRTRELRAVGIACAVPMVVYLFVGKGYYPAPTIPIVMAAGLIALSHVKRPKLRTGLVAGVIVASLIDFVALAKITIPTTSADRMHATGLDSLDSDYASTVGWVSITQQLTQLYGRLSASERATTVIVSSDYGVTGALQIYGNSML